MRVWQNARTNTVRCAMVRDVYFPFSKTITLIKGLYVYIVFLKNLRPMFSNVNY